MLQTLFQRRLKVYEKDTFVPPCLSGRKNLATKARRHKEKLRKAPRLINYATMEYAPLTKLEEKIGEAVVNAAFKVHSVLGPGLLERVYEVCMAHELSTGGYNVKRQVSIPIKYDNIVFDDGLRLDLLVNDLVVVELKAVDIINPVWKAQIISHLKLTKLRLGYLINFNVPLIKNGINRFIN